MLEGNPERDDWPDSTGSSNPSCQYYLASAHRSAEAGHTAQACMLFMTAYETAVQEESGSEGLTDGHPAVSGLHHAWELACRLEDRNLAETVYRRLAPHLTAAQSRACNARLQGFALKKLKEIGAGSPMSDGLLDSALGVPRFRKQAAPEFSLDDLLSGSDDDSDEADSEEAIPTYGDLVGFEVSVMEMRRRGFGMSEDEGFSQFMDMLGERFGMQGLPASETLLFRAPAREDAARLMLATAGELGNQVIRVRMDTNAQGAAVLCIMASPELRSGHGDLVLDPRDKATLILEDIDTWNLPLEEVRDDVDGGSGLRLSRGAAKAIALIRISVESPNIMVLASACSDGGIDEHILDLLAPLSPVDIEAPTFAERSRLWADLVYGYSAMATLDVTELVDVSAGLSRYDIVSCAHEALGQAYRESIRSRTYVRVTKRNIYEKIAALQPLDSAAYRKLEDMIVADFVTGLEGPDDIV